MTTQKEPPFMWQTCWKCRSQVKKYRVMENTARCDGGCGRHGAITLSNSREISIRGVKFYVPAG